MQTYVAEIDGRAVIAFRASSAAEAQIWLENNKAVRADLAASENGGPPLWDGKAEIVARAATFEKMAAWRRKSVEMTEEDDDHNADDALLFFVPVTGPTGAEE